MDSNGPQPSDLTVSYKGNPVGLRGVTAVRLYFWNSGTMPIQRMDILRPIQCVLPDGIEILDAKILSSSRDVSGFKIAVPNGTPNILEITFDALEKNDGGSIQLIYAGNRDAPIAFRGVVLGSKSIKLALSRLFGMAKIAPCECPRRCRRNRRPWLHPRARQPAISCPRASGGRLARQARRPLQAKRVARAALARRRSLAGRSRRGQVPIAADRSSWTDPCHFHLYRRGPCAGLKRCGATVLGKAARFRAIAHVRSTVPPVPRIDSPEFRGASTDRALKIACTIWPV